MIGRKRETAEARRLLDDAAMRSSGLLLSGEPGIGKTTIWTVAIEEARARGYTVLTARPSEAERRLAFAGLADLLHRVDQAAFEDLPDVQQDALAQALRLRGSAKGVDPTTVGLGVVGLLRALSVRSPMLVAVDDLQWLDAPTL
ncbi:MAG: ATP-binding protein, partial [Gaiella sp.]